jgi:uncharacterized damage-inducible protein DinB
MIARILPHAEATANTVRGINHSGDHAMPDTLQRLFQFKAWANDELLTTLAGLSHDSPIPGLAIKALSHTYVVDRIFIAHMTRKAHAYTSANLSEMPTLEDLSADIRASDSQFESWRIPRRRGL